MAENKVFFKEKYKIDLVGKFQGKQEM